MRVTFSLPGICKPFLRSTPVFIAALGVGACQQSVDCPADLRARFSPSDTAIVVGQQFTASVALSGCAGTESLTDVVAWSSQEPGIALVDSVSGRVSAVAAGQTHIFARGRTYGSLGSLRVVVNSPAP
jgi:Big-like domain-containing protein